MKVAWILEDSVNEQGTLVLQRKVIVTDAAGVEHDVNSYGDGEVPQALTREIMLSPAALTVSRSQKTCSDVFCDCAIQVMMSHLLLKIGEVYGIDDVLDRGPEAVFAEACAKSDKTASAIYDELSQGLVVGSTCPPKQALVMFNVIDEECIRSAIHDVIEHIRKGAREAGGDITVIDPNGIASCGDNCDCEETATA